MPTNSRETKEFFERLSALEAKVDNLMTVNKWQMGIIAAILILAFKSFIK